MKREVGVGVLTLEIGWGIMDGKGLTDDGAILGCCFTGVGDII
jgi:hypothetical protein